MKVLALEDVSSRLFRYYTRKHRILRKTTTLDDIFTPEDLLHYHARELRDDAFENCQLVNTATSMRSVFCVTQGEQRWIVNDYGFYELIADVCCQQFMRVGLKHAPLDAQPVAKRGFLDLGTIEYPKGQRHQITGSMLMRDVLVKISDAFFESDAQTLFFSDGVSWLTEDGERATDLFRKYWIAPFPVEVPPDSDPDFSQETKQRPVDLTKDVKPGQLPRWIELACAYVFGHELSHIKENVKGNRQHHAPFAQPHMSYLFDQLSDFMNTAPKNVGGPWFSQYSDLRWDLVERLISREVELNFFSRACSEAMHDRYSIRNILGQCLIDCGGDRTSINEIAFDLIMAASSANYLFAVRHYVCRVITRPPDPDADRATQHDSETVEYYREFLLRNTLATSSVLEFLAEHGLLLPDQILVKVARHAGGIFFGQLFLFMSIDMSAGVPRWSEFIQQVRSPQP